MICFVKLLQVSVGALIAVLYATGDLWHTINMTEKRRYRKLAYSWVSLGYFFYAVLE